MKAQLGVKWALLVLIVTIILVIAAIRPYQAAVAEAIRTSAFMHATEIAGIINLLQTSPDMTTYTYLMPEMEYKLKIDGDVNVIIYTEEDENSYVVDIIKSDIKIMGSDGNSRVIIECRDDCEGRGEWCRDDCVESGEITFIRETVEESGEIVDKIVIQ